VIADLDPRAFGEPSGGFGVPVDEFPRQEDGHGDSQDFDLTDESVHVLVGITSVEGQGDLGSTRVAPEQVVRSPLDVAKPSASPVGYLVDHDGR